MVRDIPFRILNVAITYAELLERQEENRAAFGRMLLNWRRTNGWTQYTACSWAEEAGFDAISYGNLSVIEQGKAGELRQKAFCQLGELNRRIAEKDWGAIQSQDIKARLEESIAIGDDDRAVWSPVEFWACYIGRREVPAPFRTLAVKETLREKLIRCGWVTPFNADTLVKCIEDHYADHGKRSEVNWRGVCE